MACGTTTLPEGAVPRTIAFVDLTEDGGASWRRTLTDGSSKLQSEESCAFGRDGAAYFTVTHEHDHQGLALYRSEDGGRTWRTMRERETFVDFTQMTVDNDPVSPHVGRLYILGHLIIDRKRELRPERRGRLPMPLLRSEDRGATLLGPVVPPPSDRPWRQITLPGGVLTLSDGTVLGAVQSMYAPESKEVPPQQREKWVEVVRSVDGGRTLSIIPVMRNQYWLPSGSLPDLPSIAAAPFRTGEPQRVYLVWSDLLSGRSTINMAVSTNGGVDWSALPALDAATRVASKEIFNHMHSNVAVNNSGVVAVSWRDIAAACWRVVPSYDGGRTFGQSISLGTCRVPADASAFEGAYSVVSGSEVGFVADAAGRFHLAWTELADAKNRRGPSRFVHASVQFPESAAAAP